MLIQLLGLSHKTAPVEVRERLHIDESKLPSALHQIHKIVPEAMIFSTCNRFEILARVDELDGATQKMSDLISEIREIPQTEFQPMLYTYSGPEAVRHVFRVAASLDSLVVGEPQILGQMKQFFAIAQHEKTIAYTLHSIMERAFMVAKKIRSETLIANSQVSISSVAVELASKIFDKLEDKTALVIGAGEMSLLTIQHLQSHGVKSILVINRTYQKAADMAREIHARAVPFEDLAGCIAESDIVISSTGSPNFIINKEIAHRAMTLRRNRPMFFVDIAVPRDIDPKINQIDGVFLYDIDDLQSVVEKNKQQRLKEAERAEEIISQEAEVFWNKLKSLDIAPTIRDIQARIEQLRKKEIEMTMKKMGDLNDAQKKALEDLTSSLTNKILQQSYSELRQLANQPDGVEKIELIRKLFRI
jgi:glutamyl-tRNA reductase